MKAGTMLFLREGRAGELHYQPIYGTVIRKQMKKEKGRRMDCTFEKAREYIYRSARPLELARFQFHFENGSAQTVLNALKFYQNKDSGFGHALEADAWNPNSAPVQVWTASTILREIGWTDASHPLVRGMLHYLEGGRDFDGRLWARKICSNNDYPHAPWWTCPEGYTEDDDNPTASLAGFILRFSDAQSTVHALGVRVARAAFARLTDGAQPMDMHTLKDYIELYEDLCAAGREDIVDMPRFKACLTRAVGALVTRDTAQWQTGYICRPSQFVLSCAGPFYAEIADLARYECAFLRETQLEDGSWNIPWRWGAYAEAWALSKCWWKAVGIVKNLRFLRGMGELNI